MARPIDPRLWRHARSARRYLVLSVALSLATTLCIVVAALALARVLAGVITDPARRDIGSWTGELALFAVAIVVRVTVTWWQSRLAHRAGAQVVAELETAVVAAGAQLPPRELAARRTELAVVAGSGLSGLRAYLAGYLPALLLSALVPPIVLTVIAFHDLVSGGIVLVTLPLIPIFMVLIGLLTQGKSQDTLAATTRLSDQLLDLFAGMPTLRALGREGAVAAQQDSSRTSMAGRVRDLGDALHKRTMSALRIAFLSSMVLEMLATLSVALVAVSIGMRLVFGNMGLYAGLVALILAPEVYLPLRMVGERFHAAQDGMAAADKAFAILEPDSSESRQAVCSSSRKLVGLSGAESQSPGVAGLLPSARRGEGGRFVELRDVSVRARDGLAPAGLSAIFRPGAITVLAGPNGSGKSTAVQSILGLIAPDRGSVTVDGIDVSDIDSEWWWSQVAWLPQRPVLVPGTLRDNLELLGPTTSHDQVEKACHATGFDTVLDTLPDRWDTVVGIGGVGLSLGQRQRLALTRTLAAPRPVLLLDEPTAHLDDASEATVLAALTARARAGATVVIVGHRPSVLAVADHVVQVRADASSEHRSSTAEGVFR
ncbi:thiol reductant ABC exporter subunit CydD [Nocardia goodfellowii]|uniref:ATP-binding cassette subfamily C protein CydD n=1 Tax=Nocardia goodfellowii TaxID=882446 RepID=A0ABS4Q7G1_9NOCA|nr:thiol reductant ABC exporter subunit CydD [Nocardia goodfellowii]MBP2187630.1 ATP-binding cassette subfamily C protein CydD [Nocardia goodfellowii]